jgi:gentisate 1,2-dioxygenase
MNTKDMPQASHSERRRLYDDMSPANLTPLWEVLHALVPLQPATPCVPAYWQYDQLRPFLMRAGELITAEEAVRRVLILENPALRGQSAVTQSLYAGLQLILPGEVAPAHRHTQSALRFIVEGQGAYTAVDGERTTMHPGDFIITPSWTWHDHGNEVSEPVVWLDGLDIPTIRFFDAGFAENADARSQPIHKNEGSSFAKYGFNMAPIEDSSPFGQTSPIFIYPFGRTREALDMLERTTALDSAHGFKLRYVNPQTGGSPMPTIQPFMQRLPQGFKGRGYRQTDGQVFSVVEGSGIAYIERGDQQISYVFGPRDHFVVPSWYTLRLESADGAVLFSYTDRPVHQSLGILKEERLSS